MDTLSWVIADRKPLSSLQKQVWNHSRTPSRRTIDDARAEPKPNIPAARRLRPCANRPIANATVDRVHPRLVPECVLRNPIEFRTPHLERRTPHEKTPPGHSSAFPDTPRDSLHVTPTTRGVRKNFAGIPVKFSEPCGPVHPRTDFPPTQISFEGQFFPHSEMPPIATGRSRCAGDVSARSLSSTRANRPPA